MSNPDFPGPPWQDRSEPHNHRGDDRYGRASNGGQQANWEREYYPAARAGYDDGSGYGRTAAYGEPSRREGGSGYYDGYDRADPGHDARYDGGRNGHGAANGYGAANGHNGNGHAQANGTDAEHYGAMNSYGAEGYGSGYDDRYSRGDRRSDGYGYDRDGYGSYGGGRSAVGDPDLIPGGPGYYGGGIGTDEDDFGSDLYRPSERDDTFARRFGIPGGWVPGGRGPGGPRRRGSRGPVGPDGRPVRPTGNWFQRQWHASWWRHWTLKKAAILTSSVAAGLTLVLVGAFLVAYNHYKLPLQALSHPLDQSSQVYFADGKTPIGCFCSQNRTVLTTAQLAHDKWLEPAFFAAEDRNYLNEGGISMTGTVRALMVDLSGSGYQGGSTITEQFIKSYLLPSGIGNLTTKQKLEEIILAVKLSKVKSKSWILTHYLNQINLGWGTLGVQAAAEKYFGKPAWNLDAAQCAMLASMVQYPAFDPTHPAKLIPLLGESLLSRWVAVLGNMARPAANTPGLTQQQLRQILPVPYPTTTAQLMQDLKHFPKIVPANQATGSWNGWRGYIMYDVQHELETTYGLTYSQIYSGGYQIVTTVSARKMRALYAAVGEAKKMMRAGGQSLPWYAHIGAVLENPKNGAIEAVYEGPNWQLPTKACNRVYCQYRMATQSRNQVGSSFKPYVLATAVKMNMNVKTSILNGYSPLCVPPETQAMTLSKRGPASSCPSDGPGWLAVSYDPVVEGPVSVQKAAAASSNAAFEDLAHRVGTRNIISLAQSFGVNTAPAPQGSGLSNDVGQIGIALGIAPLTVEEQANTFAALANGGTYHTPHFISKITQNGQNSPLKLTRHMVLTPAQAADVDWALSADTIPGGTGYPNAVLSPARPTIAKTGTTDVAQSAYFVGALPNQYSLAVGMFTNSQNNVKGGQTLDILPNVSGSYAGGTGGGFGGQWPATIWRLYMTRLLAMHSLPVAQLAPLNLTGFQKWVQVKPVKKCSTKQSKHGGIPLDHGHGHNPGGGGPGGGPSPAPCPSGGPSPNPSNSPTGTPSPTPSVTPSFSPSPNPSGSPSPSPSLPVPAKPLGGGSPLKSAASTLSLTLAVLAPRPVFGRAGWVATTTGLV